MLQKLLSWIVTLSILSATGLFVGIAIWAVFAKAATRPPATPPIGERLLGFGVIAVVLIGLIVVLAFVVRISRPIAMPLQSVQTVIAGLQRHLRRRRLYATIMLVVCLVLLCTIGRNLISPIVPAVMGTALLLVHFGGLAFEYRVASGLLGTTDNEAREIIRFALDNAGAFPGGLGAQVPNARTVKAADGLRETAR